MAPQARRVDVRGLVPCAPMEKILAALDDPATNGRVHAILDRDPIHLYPILEQRGFDWRVLVDDEDHFELLIYPAAGIQPSS